MKLHKSRALCLSSFVLFACFVVGCAPRGIRVYSGTPLPSNKVGLVVLHKNVGVPSWERLDVFSLRGENDAETKVLGPVAYNTDILELLPGKYNLGVNYSSGRETGTRTVGRWEMTQVQSTTGKSQVDINVESGKIYTLYGEVMYGQLRIVCTNIDDYDYKVTFPRSNLYLKKRLMNILTAIIVRS